MKEIPEDAVYILDARGRVIWWRQPPLLPGMPPMPPFIQLDPKRRPKYVPGGSP